MNHTVGHSEATAPPRRSRLWLFLLLIVIVLPACLFAAWVWITLHFSYSQGERAGYVQKISKKGWICKTWEGELAMSSFPGTAPQIFTFSVRDDAVAEKIENAAGQRVALSYEQHRGVPGSCFGETEYFVTSVRTLGPWSTSGELRAVHGEAEDLQARQQAAQDGRV